MSLDRRSAGRSSGPDPDPERVISALDDDACREIVAALDEPMTVSEISDEAEVPLSTAYKKLDRLTAASLVGERTQLRPGGHHRSRYVTRFDRVAVELDADREFQVDIERPLSDPEHQLVDMWSAVRHGT
ncbi:winged helix-turn-helix domain-containing protein [Halosolutus halophilus]|uniref:winged helix-turn-helix domain-containing protein n=1 Tax=Halosolutus halophilus TaxID=1552990 RepID=UPI0022350C61|nr:helix-turn-helix domain-containing protein [Halosolutus halophilus]